MSVHHAGWGGYTIAIRQNQRWGLRHWIPVFLLCVISVLSVLAVEPRSATHSADPTRKAGLRGNRQAASRELPNFRAQRGDALLSDPKFAHLTTRDGLAMDNVVSILQDRRGFMWFGTGDGLNRYDGNSFVVYKNNPNDPRSRAFVSARNASVRG